MDDIVDDSTDETGVDTSESTDGTAVQPSTFDSIMSGVGTFLTNVATPAAGVYNALKGKTATPPAGTKVGATKITATNTKTWLYIGGGVALVVLIVILKKRR